MFSNSLNPREISPDVKSEMNLSACHDWQKLFQGRLLTERECLATLQAFDLALPEISKIPGLIELPAIECRSKGWVCNRCTNEDPDNFYFLPGQTHQVYCLNCMNFSRLTSLDKLYYLPDVARGSSQNFKDSQLTWQGSLSSQQERAAHETILSLEDHESPHMIHAVTGAGKTEMIFPVIDQVLSRGGRVAIASPRIDVCLELFPRLKAAFAEVEIDLLYGASEHPYQGHSLTIATTHQLVRFKEAFNLLIIDEVDAFPYVFDLSLHRVAHRAVKEEGKLVYLTATPDATLQQAQEAQQLTVSLLPARFHGYPLPEPKFVWLGDWERAIQTQKNNSTLFKQVKAFIGCEGAKLIFMSNIRLAIRLSQWMEFVFPNLKMNYVFAEDPDRVSKVQTFREGGYDLLVSTTILERGVTFVNCQVFIIGADHPQFTKSSLVQMSGRVGRKAEFPTGKLIYGHYGKSRSMIEARDEIRRMNQAARPLLQTKRR